jgi:ABC-2 type transport system permease protein
MTGNENMAYGVTLVIMFATVVTFFIDSSRFEGLMPSIMTKLSLFDRFSTFVNGIFDMTAVVYYLTVIAFFLFLSVQSLEKRRYN